jgi:hypothetical protein
MSSTYEELKAQAGQLEADVARFEAMMASCRHSGPGAEAAWAVYGDAVRRYRTLQVLMGQALIAPIVRSMR